MTDMNTWLSLAVVLFSLQVAGAEEPPVIVDHVRFFPVAKQPALMIGGKFAGSNVSATDGFQVLAEITAEPKGGEWTEVNFKNKTPLRWVRYQAPSGSKGGVAEVEFYAGARKLNGAGYGSTGGWWRADWRMALDGNTETFFNSGIAKGAFVGLDLGEQASARRPQLTAKGGDRAAKVVTLETSTSGATIRYTLDGTLPGADSGNVYAKPINVSATTTIVAVAFKEGLAPSPPAFATYQVGAPRVINSFHVGNSLTMNASWLPLFAKTAGIESDFRVYGAAGALTAGLWKSKEGTDSKRWDRAYAAARHPLDHFTMQPRDFDIDAEVEAELKFINLVREKSPDVQPWLYAEWVERGRHRPSDRGLSPSYQMSKLFPALTWQESMSAMLLYVEEVQHRLVALDKTGKRARILPCSIAMAVARTLVDNRQFPGIPPGEDSYYATFFGSAPEPNERSFYARIDVGDPVHLNLTGCYLVDLVWYAAFTRQSPEGKLLPIGTTLTSEQAKILQRLAWDIVKNYPDCGLYEKGTAATGAPLFAQPAATIDAPTAIHLTSATPGAFFRYTLDGTPPTRTRGYVYCGVITVRPGMTVKAIAFKSGMADSAVAEATFLTRPAR